MADITSVGGYMVVNGVSIAPIGSSLEMYGDVVPKGYSVCDGGELSQTDYPELYAIIGHTYATTGGATFPGAGKFRKPPQEVDGLGLFNRGVGATSGAIGTYKLDVYKSHTHTYTRFSGATSAAGGAVQTGYNSHTYSNQVTNDAGDTTETRPRSLTVLKCICLGKEEI